MSAIAALSRDPRSVRIGSLVVSVGHHPAAAWLAALKEVGPHAVILKLVDDADRERLLDLLTDGDLDMAPVKAASIALVEECGAAGKWWKVLRLAMSSDNFKVLGALVLRGLDPWRSSLGEWCSATYALMTEHMDEKDRHKLDFELSLPPAGLEDEWEQAGDDWETQIKAAQELMGLS